MSAFTKKFTEEEMMQMLEKLLHPGENIRTAVYCGFKETGFLADNRNIIIGYAAVTDRDRLIGYRMNLLSTAEISLDMDYLTKIKISKNWMGHTKVHMVFQAEKKYEVKIQIVPKVGGGKFPHQQENNAILLDILKEKQNALL